LDESVCVSTQVPLQKLRLFGHAQVEPAHCRPPLHEVPQLPQFDGSSAVSTQVPLHVD
jgi:hypothetical protein